MKAFLILMAMNLSLTSRKGNAMKEVDAKRNVDASACQGQDDDKTKKYAKFAKTIFRRALFALFVFGVAVVVVRTGRNGNTSGGLNDGDQLKHLPMEYVRFLDDKGYEWSLSDSLKVELKLETAFPQQDKVKFRFAGVIKSGDKLLPCELLVSSVPRIEDESIVLYDFRKEAFDINGDEVQGDGEYKDLPATVFSLFIKEARFVSLPIYTHATTILRMTRAEMLVK